MKRLVSIISLLAVVLTISALEPKKVKFSCDLTTINKTENCHPRGPWTLTDVDGGWCIVRQDKYPDIPLGNKGLLIYKDCHTGKFWCYDIQCPMCEANGVEHEIWDSLYHYEEEVVVNRVSGGGVYYTNPIGMHITAHTEAHAVCIKESYNVTVVGDYVNVYGDGSYHYGDSVTCRSCYNSSCNTSGIYAYQVSGKV